MRSKLPRKHSTVSPYQAEEEFRQLIMHGRIIPEDITETLLENLDKKTAALPGTLGTRFHLWEVMLNHRLKTGPAVRADGL